MEYSCNVCKKVIHKRRSGGGAVVLFNDNWRRRTEVPVFKGIQRNCPTRIFDVKQRSIGGGWVGWIDELG